MFSNLLVFENIMDIITITLLHYRFNYNFLKEISRNQTNIKQNKHVKCKLIITIFLKKIKRFINITLFIVSF